MGRLRGEEGHGRHYERAFRGSNHLFRVGDSCECQNDSCRLIESGLKKKRNLASTLLIKDNRQWSRFCLSDDRG
jgi:hypothetical protein